MIRNNLETLTASEEENLKNNIKNPEVPFSAYSEAVAEISSDSILVLQSLRSLGPDAPIPPCRIAFVEFEQYLKSLKNVYVIVLDRDIAHSLDPQIQERTVSCNEVARISERLHIDYYKKFRESVKSHRQFLDSLEMSSDQYRKQIVDQCLLQLKEAFPHTFSEPTEINPLTHSNPSSTSLPCESTTPAKPKCEKLPEDDSDSLESATVKIIQRS